MQLLQMQNLLLVLAYNCLHVTEMHICKICNVTALPIILSFSDIHIYLYGMVLNLNKITLKVIKRL